MHQKAKGNADFTDLAIEETHLERLISELGTLLERRVGYPCLHSIATNATSERAGCYLPGV